MPEVQPSSDLPKRGDGNVVDPAVLAERRARRAEMAEESLVDRVRAAEQVAADLEARATELQQGLADVAQERDALQSELRVREHELIAVAQREEAERRRRHELEIEGDADRRELEAEVADLRARLDAAGARADELAAELEHTRSEVDALRREADVERATRQRLEVGAQDVAALSRVLEGRREQVEVEIGALRDRAGALADELAAAEQTRVEAERRMVAERERAEAEVTLLQHELDRRAEIHDAVRGHLQALGSEVARVRDAATADSAQRAATEAALVQMGETTQRLEASLGALERERDVAGEQLANARAALAVRDDDVARAQAELAAVRAELDAVRADAERQGAALAESEHTMQSLRAGADELHAALNGERELRTQLAAELDRERRGFEEKLGGVERTVGLLRGRLAEASQELEQQLAGERGARQAAEAQLLVQREEAAADRARLEAMHAQLAEELAVAQAALVDERAQSTLRAVAEREQTEAERARADASESLAASAVDERDRLAAELAQRTALDNHVRTTLTSLREELTQVRAETDVQAAREAAVERLVADLVTTAGQLREGFDRELETVRGQFEERVQDARGAELAAAEERLGAMRGHLETSVERLRGELEDEQAARRTAEDALAAERDRVEFAGLAAVDAAVARDALARELAERRETEDDARAALAAAEEELTLLRREHAGQADALAVVESLTRAAQRLRSETPPTDLAGLGDPLDAGLIRAADLRVVPEPGDPADADAAGHVDRQTGDEALPASGDAGTSAGAGPHGSGDAGTFAGAGPSRSGEARAISDAAPSALAGRPTGPQLVPVVELASRVATTEADGVLVRPHVVPAADRRPSPWLAQALTLLSRTDPVAARSILLALLRTQRSGLSDDVTYDLTVRGHGTWRVAISDSAAKVEPLRPESESPDVSVVGELAALVPLAAGGAGRRLPSVDVRGSRRRWRRVLKTRRAPVELAALGGGALAVSPGAFLRLLVGVVDPGCVSGHDFQVDYAVAGALGGTWRVRARAGRLTLDEPGPEAIAPSATVRIAHAALVPLLTANPLPPGERLMISGDQDALRLLTNWFTQTQGLVRG